MLTQHYPSLLYVSNLIHSEDDVFSADCGRGPMQILGRAMSKKTPQEQGPFLQAASQGCCLPFSVTLGRQEGQGHVPTLGSAA